LKGGLAALRTLAEPYDSDTSGPQPSTSPASQYSSPQSHTASMSHTRAHFYQRPHRLLGRAAGVELAERQRAPRTRPLLWGRCPAGADPAIPTGLSPEGKSYRTAGSGCQARLEPAQIRPQSRYQAMPSHAWTTSTMSLAAEGVGRKERGVSRNCVALWWQAAGIIVQPCLRKQRSERSMCITSVTKMTERISSGSSRLRHSRAFGSSVFKSALCLAFRTYRTAVTDG
jgi:hypothetical protein